MSDEKPLGDAVLEAAAQISAAWGNMDIGGYRQHVLSQPNRAHALVATAAAQPAVRDRVAKAQEEEIRRLREALAPFAKAADVKLGGEWKDHERPCHTDVSFYINFGHLRAARAALAQEG